MHKSQKKTYKLLRDWELEQLNKTKVITSSERETAGRKIGAVNICFVSVSRPHANYFIT